MLFNTLTYALFLPLVLACYFCLPRRFQSWTLLLASYLFYASWNIYFLPLIIFLTLVNFYLGKYQGQFLAKENGRAAKILLVSSILINLGVLAFFKYSVFLFNNILRVGVWFGITNTDSASFSIILPLGISFFTFEFIHYQIDIKRSVAPINSLLRFAVFAAFFPTQIAGPIKRFENFDPQLDLPHRFNPENLVEGLKLYVRGLFKKVALADNMANFVVIGFAYARDGVLTLTPYDAWLAALAMAMQIYFDFSGYTDMGRGSAKMLGFDVPENFLSPYLSTNLGVFWRRWHISLSSWLRDYLYIPLGGNRRWRYRNLFLTMALGGLWHGANWTFVIWGAYHGVGLIFYNALLAKIKWPKKLATLAGFGGWLITFVFVVVGWVFFRAESPLQALKIVLAMFLVRTGNAEVYLAPERLAILLVVAGYLAIALLPKVAKRIVAGSPDSLALQQSWKVISYYLQPTGYILLLLSVILFRPPQTIQFIYFQF